MIPAFISKFKSMLNIERRDKSISSAKSAAMSIFDHRLGNNDWQQARAKSEGYEAPLILDRALTSAIAVKNGEAAYERDTVLFKVPAYRWQMLACLATVAASKGGRIHVLDIGGSVASVYFQHKLFLNMLGQFNWSVVEQPHIVAAGQNHLQEGSLQFFDNIDSAERLGPIDITLFLSSLQYMPDPYEVLSRVAKTNSTHLIVDRIFLTDLPDDEVIVQQVPAAIYPASYPQWRLSRLKLLSFITKDMGFKEKANYVDGIDGDDHSGLFFQKE